MFCIKICSWSSKPTSGSIEESNLTAVLEFGLDENYVMILYENNQLLQIFSLRTGSYDFTVSNNQEEMEALVNDIWHKLNKLCKNLRLIWKKN